MTLENECLCGCECLSEFIRELIEELIEELIFSWLTEILVTGPEGAARARAEETPPCRARWSCPPAAWPPASPATGASQKNETWRNDLNRGLYSWIYLIWRISWIRGIGSLEIPLQSLFFWSSEWHLSRKWQQDLQCQLISIATYHL